MDTPRILIALATYNERENLPNLVQEILLRVPDADLLVVDDASPDGTGDWAEEFAQSEPRIHLLRRSGKLGLGSAVLAIFAWAIEQRYDFLVNLDADFSHPPEKIPELLETALAAEADVVIGSRYVTGGRVVGWPLRRRLMSRSVNLAARFLLGLTTKDNSGAFRCYRVAALEKIDADQVLSRGYSFFEEILFRLKKTGARFVEVPITFTDRVRGESKINRGEAIRAVGILLRLAAARLCGR